MHVARKWLIPDTYSFFPIKTIYVKSLSNVTIPYTTGVVHEKCWQECELGEIQNKLYPYPRVSQSGWRWLSNGDVSLRWGGCISSPCCSDWTLASLAWKSGTSGHPLLSKRFLFFFSVERFVFCRQMPYQKQPSPSIITIKGGVFYYQMGQYLEGTRCDLRLIVWEPREGRWASVVPLLGGSPHLVSGSLRHVTTVYYYKAFRMNKTNPILRGLTITIVMNHLTVFRHGMILPSWETPPKSTPKNLQNDGALKRVLVGLPITHP